MSAKNGTDVNEALNLFYDGLMEGKDVGVDNESTEKRCGFKERIKRFFGLFRRRKG